VIDVGAAYKEDPDVVMAALREIGDELAADPRHQLSILEPLQILGVEAFGDSQVTIRVRIKTLPLKQWEVGRELRRRIKKGFDARGIEIPFPHLSVYFGEKSQPFVVRQAS
jgi:small conductance mechanosensitive channel